MQGTESEKNLIYDSSKSEHEFFPSKFSEARNDTVEHASSRRAFTHSILPPIRKRDREKYCRLVHVLSHYNLNNENFYEKFHLIE